MQLGLAIAERLEGLDRLDHVVAVRPGPAVALAHEVQAFGERQPAGILDVAAVDDVAERPHLAPGLVFELDTPHRFEVDAGDLLARPQIGDGLGPRRRGDAERNAAAHAAAIEAQNEARPLRGAAMDERIDAKRPVQADQPRRYPLEDVETGPPHQRAIAEDPKVPGLRRLDCVHHPVDSRPQFRSPNRMTGATQWRRAGP